MIKAQLRDFIERVIQNKVISADDVKHLLRSILEEGVSTRDEVESLMALDRTVEADPSWAEALTSLVVDFVVWGARPTGSVTAEDAGWLVPLLTAASSDTARTLAAAIVAEAQDVDERLAGFAEAPGAHPSFDLAA